MKLLDETIDMLRQYLDAGASGVLETIAEDDLLLEVAGLLQAYELDEHSSMTILGCYVLIGLAMRKHLELVLHDNGALTRGILDGDYLLGLYYRMMAARREWKLIAHLAPFQKKMQSDLLQGRHQRAVMAELRDELRRYLDKQCA